MALHNQNPNFPKSENSSIIFSSSPPISSGESISGHHLITNIIIATVSVSSAVLFLVITYYTVLIRRRTRRSDPPAGENGGSSESEHGEPDYHVWHVRTVGLEESAINSIPVKPYVSGSGTAADCSVCLGDFCEGELVRFLPACGHAFHVLCIDTWLRAHTSCPLCRANIFDIDVDVSFEEGEFSSVVRVLDDFEEDQDVDAGDRSLDYIGLPENALEDESRFEVDSLPENDLSFRCDREERLEDGGVLNRAKQASGSIEESQQKKAMDSGGGSSSGSGKIFFFSRYGRSRSSPVLPT